MTLTFVMRRALPLGLALGATACGLDKIMDARPRFLQTWNLPADSTRISVASVLPPNVAVYSTPASSPPDSSAFQITMSLQPVSRSVGLDCVACQPLDGTTAIKPAFVLAAGSVTALPTDVVSGGLIAGQINVSVTNNMSFDPIRVKTGPGAQGYMLIVLRSGSMVFGRDSLNGATTAFAPGAMLIRPITLQPGVITNNISVDVTINSPVGDTPVPINASGTLGANATVPDLRLSTVRINVNDRTLLSPGGERLDLAEIDDVIVDHVEGAELEMTISNPFAITGNVNVNFQYGPAVSDAVAKTVAFPTGDNQVRTVALTKQDMTQLFGNEVALTVNGGVSSSAPIDITPRQVIVIGNRLRLFILTGSAN